MSKEGAPRSVNDQEAAKNKLSRWFQKKRAGAPHAKVEVAIAKRDAKTGSKPFWKTKKNNSA